ncbi:MAG TPA: hypothetical protein PK174_03945, partial [Anaerolineaceae bacterium]|nr:hypothetical protein [Anaerolineaceae bacterium]
CWSGVKDKHVEMAGLHEIKQMLVAGVVHWIFLTPDYIGNVLHVFEIPAEKCSLTGKGASRIIPEP